MLKNIICSSLICLQINHLFGITPQEVKTKIINVFQAEPNTFIEKNLNEAVVCQYYHFANDPKNAQSISLLIVDSKSPKIKLKVVGTKAVPLATVKSYAEKNNAIAGVNAGYYDMNVGTHCGMLKIDGEYIEKSVGEQGALFLINQGKFGKLANCNFDEVDKFDSAIYTFDHIIRDGKFIMPQNNSRYPRSIVGESTNGQVIFMVIDGKLPGKANGMTFEEASKILLALNCVNAINFDGGGSATMYAKDFNSSSIVNCPSDNKKFDHQGVRKVNSAVLLLAN